LLTFYASLLLATFIGAVTVTLLGSAFARRGFPLPNSQGRVGFVDGLRGYLALMVCVHHFVIWSGVKKMGTGWGEPTLNVLNQLGAGAVAFFFMITGLLFYAALLRERDWSFWLRLFVGRSFRILPLQLSSIALVLLILTISTGNSLRFEDARSLWQWVTAWDQPALLGFVSARHVDAGVLWSLRWEWFFYLLVLPASATMLNILCSRGRPTFILPLILIALSLAARLTAGPSEIFRWWHCLPLFAAGMLTHEVRVRPELRELLGQPVFGGTAAAMLLPVLLITRDPYGPHMVVFTALFVSIASGFSLSGTLGTVGARVLGEVSFGIYLLHGIALWVGFQTLNVGSALPLWALPALLPAYMAVAVILAVVAHLVIERPAIALGRQMQAKVATLEPLVVARRKVPTI